MTEGHVAVDCYVRADAISDPVESHLESVRSLARDGAVDEWRVQVWPSEVVLTPVTEESLAVERFRTFDQWAAQWGVHIDPQFRQVTRNSDLTGETREVLRTPTLCLAVHVDGRLREVFPHRSKGTTYSVEDAIETLRDGVPTVTDSGTDAPAGADHCPECEGQLTTGQGLYSCPRCRWTGVAAGRGGLRRYDVVGLADDGGDGEDDDVEHSKLHH